MTSTTPLTWPTSNFETPCSLFDIPFLLTSLQLLIDQKKIRIVANIVGQGIAVATVEHRDGNLFKGKPGQVFFGEPIVVRVEPILVEHQLCFLVRRKVQHDADTGRKLCTEAFVDEGIVHL